MFSEIRHNNDTDILKWTEFIMSRVYGVRRYRIAAVRYRVCYDLDERSTYDKFVDFYCKIDDSIFAV